MLLNWGNYSILISTLSLVKVVLEYFIHSVYNILFTVRHSLYPPGAYVLIGKKILNNYSCLIRIPVGAKREKNRVLWDHISRGLAGPQGSGKSFQSNALPTELFQCPREVFSKGEIFKLKLNVVGII